MSTARENAEGRLNRVAQNPDWSQVHSLRGIGWALLDLADAIRESRPRGIPAPPPPPPPGQNPARGA